MNDTNKKIDKYLRKQRLKNIGYVVLSTVIIAAVFLAISMPPLGKQSNITGTVITLTANQHDEGHSLKMLVKLKTGKEVFVFIPRPRFYEKGKTVKLLKREPLFFGRTIYSYRGYEK